MSWRNTIVDLSIESPGRSWRDTLKEEIPEEGLSWEELNVPKESKTNMAQDFTRGAAQGLTLGTSDEIGGRIQQLLDYFGGVSDVNKQLADQGFTGDVGPTSSSEFYEKARDEQRVLDKEAKESSPKVYMAGNIIGSLLPSLTPLGLASKIGTSVPKAAGLGAGYGAAQAAGYSEEEGLAMLPEIAGGALTGGFTGGVLQKLSNKVASLKPDDIAKYLGGKAEIQSAKALGLERATRKKLGEDLSKAVGRQGLDKKAISFGSSADDMIAVNKQIKKAAMDQRSAAYSAIDDLGASTVSPQKIVKGLDETLGDFNKLSPLNSAKLRQLDDIVEAVNQRGSGSISMKEAQKLIEEIDGAAKWDTAKPTPANKMAKAAYRYVRGAINEAAETASDKVDIPGLGDVVRKANREFSLAENTQELLANKFARDANKSIGITDTITAVGAPVLLPAKRLWESYGNQSLAIGLDNMSKLVKQNPQAFGKFSGVLSSAAKRGPQALGATHFVLQQQSPEYRKMIFEDDQESEE